MAELASFRDVIDLWRGRTSGAWGAREAMASEISAPASAVSKWWQRDNIPPEWWQSILDSETGKSGGVTADLLTELAARRAPTREPAEARP